MTDYACTSVDHSNQIHMLWAFVPSYLTFYFFSVLLFVISPRAGLIRGKALLVLRYHFGAVRVLRGLFCYQLILLGLYFYDIVDQLRYGMSYS